MRCSVPNRSFILLVLTLIFLIGSCTIQKRVHRKGWFVQWNFDQRNTSTTPADSAQGSLSVQGESEAELRELQLAESNVSTEIELQNEAIASIESSTKNQSNAEVFETRDVEINAIIHNDISNSLDVASKTELEVKDNNLSKAPDSRLKMKSISPTRVPLLAWTLLFIGITLVVLAVIFGLIYFVISGSFIGAPVYLGIMLLGGIISLALATRTALDSMNSQPAAPDPRVEREEPKKEKTERQPLKKGDKIFIAVAAGILALIGIVLISY